MNSIESVNKFVQGTVWNWENRRPQVQGVQSGKRPVLIISNDIFNKRSYVVNCVSITGVLKDSPVHEPVFINKDSHIQCEQIHTINKDDLHEYIGAVPNSTMMNVKAKLRIQFDMAEDRNLQLLTSIKNNVENLVRKLEESTASTDSPQTLPLEDPADILKNIHDMEERLVGQFSEMKKIIYSVPSSDSANRESNTSGEHKASRTTAKAAKATAPATPGKKNYRRYTEDDKKFILDKNQPIEAVMERYGYSSKQQVHQVRAKFRQKMREESIG